MAPKRAAGGGRKPTGPFEQNTAQLTVRMPADMRAQLDAAAKERGWSLTQELLRRVYDSFGHNRGKESDPAARGLEFLISHVADIVHAEHTLSEAWHLDPFMFQAFKHGVAIVLNELTPPGKARPPDLKNFQVFGLGAHKNPEVIRQFRQRIADAYKTPEGAGQFAAESVLQLLFSPLEMLKDWKSQLGNFDTRHPDHWKSGDPMESEFHKMSNVRRDLGIVLGEPKS
jgi:hypothetical protein